MRRLSDPRKTNLNKHLCAVVRQVAIVVFCMIFAVPHFAFARTPQSALSPAPKVLKSGKSVTHVIENRDDRGKIKTQISATSRMTEIKIDAHSSGTASSWEVTAGKTTVRASAPYLGQFSKVEVLKHKPNGILAVQMRLSADRRKYVVMSSEMRPYGLDFSQLTFNDFNAAPVCEDNNSPRELAAVFANAVSNDVQSLESRWACELKKRQWLFLDKSCESMLPEDRKKMMEGLAKVYASPATRAVSPARALACMENLGLPEQSARVQAILLQNWVQAEQVFGDSGGDSTGCEAQEVINGRNAVDIDLPGGRLIKCQRDPADLNAQGSYDHASGRITLKRNVEDYERDKTNREKEYYGYGAREGYATTLFHELVHASGINGSNTSIDRNVQEQLTEGIEKCCTEPTNGGSHKDAASSCAFVENFVRDAREGRVVASAQATDDPVRAEYRRYEEMFSRLMHVRVQGSGRADDRRAFSANGSTDYLLVKEQVAARHGPEVSAQLLNTYFATFELNQATLERDFRQCLRRAAPPISNQEYQCAGLISGRIRAMNALFFREQCPAIIRGNVPQAEVRSLCARWNVGFDVMGDPNNVTAEQGSPNDERLGYRVLAGYFGGTHRIPTLTEVRARITWDPNPSIQVVLQEDAAVGWVHRSMQIRVGNVSADGLRIAAIDRRPPETQPQTELPPTAPRPQIAVGQLQPSVVQPNEVLVPLQELQISELQPNRALNVVTPAQPQPTRKVLEPIAPREVIAPLTVDQRLAPVHTTAPGIVAPARAAAEAAETGGSLVFGSGAVAPRPAAAAAVEPARREVVVRSSDFDSPIAMRESDLGVPSLNRGRYEPAATTERGTAPVQALLSFADRVAQAALPQAQAVGPIGASGAIGASRAPANSFDNPFSENPSAPSVAAAPGPAASSTAQAAVALAPLVQNSNLADLTRSNFSAARTQGVKPTAPRTPQERAQAAAAAKASAASSGSGSRSAQAPRDREEDDAPRRGGTSPDAPARAKEGDEDPQATNGRRPARAAQGARAARPRVYASEDSLRSFLQSPDYTQVSSSLSTTALGVALIDYNYRITNEAGVTYGSQARDAKVLVYCHAKRRLMAPGACR